MTTSFGPRVSVVRAHAADPSSAEICTSMNRPMISPKPNPSVFAAKTAENAITVFTPSSYTRYAVRKRRISARPGSRRISRSVRRVSPRPRATATRSGTGRRASAGSATNAGIEKAPNSAAATRKQAQ